MQSFRVILSLIENQDKFKFITVEDCIDMDDCIQHIFNTEQGWVIDRITQL